MKKEEQENWIRFFAHQVRSLRLRLDIAQDEFARQLDVGRQTAARLERAEVQSIPIPVLVQLLLFARKLDMTADEFIFGTDPLENATQDQLKAAIAKKIVSKIMGEMEEAAKPTQPTPPPGPPDYTKSAIPMRAKKRPRKPSQAAGDKLTPAEITNAAESVLDIVKEIDTESHELLDRQKSKRRKKKQE